MKELIKKILNNASLYHFMQGWYRQSIFYGTLLLFRIKYFKYKGTGFTCNFCNKQYEKFAPHYAAKENRAALEKYKVIAGDGENIYCPYCMSTSRERLILQILKDEINSYDKKILHLSPEKKVFDYLKGKANIITADKATGFYRLVDKNIMYADATALPFKNEAFDIVIANHIMEHIPEDLKAMKEICRVLKQGGRAIMQIPFSNSLTETIEEPFICDAKKQSQLFGQKRSCAYL